MVICRIPALLGALIALNTANAQVLAEPVDTAPDGAPAAARSAETVSESVSESGSRNDPESAPATGLKPLRARVPHDTLAPGLVTVPKTVKVPPGNRMKNPPGMPGSTIKRLLATKSSTDRKYEKVMRQLSRNEKLLNEIRSVAVLYDLDPVHIIGALVGEHTFNVDVFDTMQSYYIKAASYLELDTRFEYEGESVDEFVSRPQFAACRKEAGSYVVWDCREQVWNEVFAGHMVDGVKFDDLQFDETFFRPFYAGQTFGLGQISPLAALKVNDIVTGVGGLPELSAGRPSEVYFTVMEPEASLHYIAAIIRHSIDSYRDIAGMDISSNPGITATLYNLGGVERRALKLKRENALRRAAGRPLRMPTENYYGWLVNDRLDDLIALLDEREQAGIRQ
ncbi:MAG TPA: DUF1402 family protein [Afifellaceae bacterium]|nr:DUF1402 family protein [Afifellaceae bacterium]